MTSKNWSQKWYGVLHFDENFDGGRCAVGRAGGGRWAVGGAGGAFKITLLIVLYKLRCIASNSTEEFIYIFTPLFTHIYIVRTTCFQSMSPFKLLLRQM